MIFVSSELDLQVFFLLKFLLLNPKSKVLVLEAGLKKFDNLSSLSGRNSIGVDFKLSPTINIGFEEHPSFGTMFLLPWMKKIFKDILGYQIAAGR